MADTVVDEIKKAGGEAIANYDSVSTREGADGMLWSALNKFGKVDVLVNNAGVLRDKSFLNMSDTDWDLVCDVHMKGTCYCAQAVCRQLKVQEQWRAHHQHHVGERPHGQLRPGQLLGGEGGHLRLHAHALDGDGARQGHGNAIAPVAFTRMTEDLKMLQAMPNAKEMLAPHHISPVALFLASDLVGRHQRHDRRRHGDQGFGLQDDRDERNDAEGCDLDGAGAARALGRDLEVASPILENRR